MDIAPARPSVGPDALHRRSVCHHGLFSVTKGLDKTTPKIIAACSNGVVFKHAVVYVCRQDYSELKKSSQPKPFMSIVLTKPIIADLSYGYTDGNGQIEQLAFRYASIAWELKWVDPDEGEAKNLPAVGWDGLENSALKANTNIVPDALKWKNGLLG